MKVEVGAIKNKEEQSREEQHRHNATREKKAKGRTNRQQKYKKNKEEDKGREETVCRWDGEVEEINEENIRRQDMVRHCLTNTKKNKTK